MVERSGGDPGPPFPGADWVYDLAACLRFFTRLPIPPLPDEPAPYGIPDFRTVPRMLPIAALLLALPAALVLVLAWEIRLGPFVAAALALAALALVTGAMHEDGLADVADGFGGGRSAERSLEIMRDSRIGAFGGTALFLGLALRAATLATLLDRSGWLASVALLYAASVSRSAALVPIAWLPPARPGGAGAAVGRPSQVTLAVVGGLCLALALVGAALGLPPLGLGLGLVLAPAAAFALSALARRKIGGQTGDVVGACQQLGEIAVLLALVGATA
ncbi:MULTISPECIES: adenosylcobinamide-GDP ribazoletransferase [Methylorubrum]|uniref:Adenosylcobinamide-GDP ribazoletransferase n=3 Tax=Methylorubrum suomiense TaxID=144191 RepID=A0ABQ4UNI4_9HYPH|nr:MULTISPECIES: adenosylcobinamide-GDP ribazoletransferase [Methylobacteriaceae]GJE73768.1 Adenosylcobinamide-GDP ribazoletransferase [Methylorubrum suomiense]